MESLKPEKYRHRDSERLLKTKGEMNMFERLFGSTMEEQLIYLQPRILLTAPVIIGGFIATAYSSSGGAIIAIAAYIWAWTFLKNWFGITTIGALFSGNIVIGVILLVAYLVIGYIIGLFIFLLGLIRLIQLKFICKL